MDFIAQAASVEHPFDRVELDTAVARIIFETLRDGPEREAKRRLGLIKFWEGQAADFEHEDARLPVGDPRPLAGQAAGAPLGDARGD